MTSRDSRPPRGTPTVPRWAKVTGTLTVLALVIYLGTMWLGGGHGPDRHAPEHPPAEQTGPPDGHQAPGHQPPAGGHG